MKDIGQLLVRWLEEGHVGVYEISILLSEIYMQTNHRADKLSHRVNAHQAAWRADPMRQNMNGPEAYDFEYEISRQIPLKSHGSGTWRQGRAI